MRKPIGKISNNYRQESAWNSKMIFWDFVFYLLLGAVITLSVQIGGIVVVFAFLIIPAAISVGFSVRLQSQLVIAWLSAIIASLAGMLFAYRFDFSIGPAIALFLGVELIIIKAADYAIKR